MTEHHEAAVTTKDDTPRKQTPGEMLRTQRESAGLSLQAVSEALHLTVHYIKSLENDDYTKLPGLTFVKGYFRAYARYLRMDVDTVLASYESYLATKGLRQHVHDFSTTSIGSIGSSGRSDQSFAWALVAGVILVIALAAGWWFFGREMEVSLARTPAPTTQNAARTTATAPATQAQSNPTPGTAQSFTAPRSFTQNSTTAPASNGAAVNSTTQAADAGVAVINATLEARQEEEALLANNAQAAGVTDGTNTAVPGNTTAPATTATPATTSIAAPAAAAGTTAPLDSYTAPATPNASATLPAPSVGGIALQDPPATSAAEAAATAPTTVLDDDAQEVITEPGGARVITLRGTGNDRFEIQLNGNSWAEIHDAQGTDLFSDMLRQGDKLSVEGTAPFTVLLGDARQVQASFNTQALDLTTLVRSDNTARFRLGAEGVSAIIRDQIEQAAATE
jgi:cytoskeleton protein RodZ